MDEVVSSNIFHTLASLSQELSQGTADPDSIGLLLNDIQQDLQLILSNRSTIGARINRVDTSRDRFEAIEVFIAALLSKNEDADLAVDVADRRFSGGFDDARVRPCVEV